MMTVLRKAGFRIVIFPNDHEPAHVHVYGDGEMKVNLVGPNGEPKLEWAVGMSHADIRKACAIVFDNRLLLLKRWDDLR